VDCFAPSLLQEVPVLGITAEYICLTVKVITTNLKLLKQQDWCEKQIISHFTCQFIGLVNWGSQKLAHARKAGIGVKKSIIHEAFYPHPNPPPTREGNNAVAKFGL
jgi:hypothetical protein